MSDVPQDLIDQVKDLETRVSALETAAPATADAAVQADVERLKTEVEPPVAA